MENSFSIKDYVDLLIRLRDSGYTFCKFHDVSSHAIRQQVILRHDIDFSLEHAAKIAAKEHELDVRSSFFVHLRSPLYNLLSPENLETLRTIYALGHDIGLHIDLMHYKKDYKAGILKEIDLLSHFCDFTQTSIVSLHRPGKLGIPLTSIEPPPNVQHTYQKQYFTDMAYFSDSRNKWGQHGNPISSIAFEQKLPMQIVTHPLWWVVSGNSAIQKIYDHAYQNSKVVVEHIEKTAVSFSLHDLRNFLED